MESVCWHEILWAPQQSAWTTFVDNATHLCNWAAMTTLFHYECLSSIVYSMANMSRVAMHCLTPSLLMPTLRSRLPGDELPNPAENTSVSIRDRPSPSLPCFLNLQHGEWPYMKEEGFLMLLWAETPSKLYYDINAVLVVTLKLYRGKLSSQSKTEQHLAGCWKWSVFPMHVFGFWSHDNCKVMAKQVWTPTKARDSWIASVGHAHQNRIVCQQKGRTPAARSKSYVQYCSMTLPYLYACRAYSQILQHSNIMCPWDSSHASQATKTHLVSHGPGAIYAIQCIFCFLLKLCPSFTQDTVYFYCPISSNVCFPTQESSMKAWMISRTRRLMQIAYAYRDTDTGSYCLLHASGLWGWLGHGVCNLNEDGAEVEAECSIAKSSEDVPHSFCWGMVDIRAPHSAIVLVATLSSLAQW